MAWSRGVLRFRTPIVLFWLLVSVFGFSLSSSLNSHLSSSLSVPHTQSEIANQVVRDHFGENIEGAFTVIYNFKNATPSEIELIKKSIVAAVAEIPGASLTQQRALGGTLFASIQTQKGLMDASRITEELRDSLRSHGLDRALVTGAPALASDLKPVLNADLHRGEILALLLALIFLIATLGLTWSIFIPFIAAAATIGSSIAILDLIARKTLIVIYTPNLIELIALGLAIDYTLLLVQRYRQEQSIEKMMETAGRTVLLSGTTVAIGISTLMAIPIPFIRSLGVAGLLVPAMSLATSLTLTPALLAVIGGRAVRPLAFNGLLMRIEESEGIWGRLADLAISRPRRVLVATLLPLLVIGSLALFLDLTPSSTHALPRELESSKALSLLVQTGGPGIITPNEIVVDLGRSGAASEVEMVKARLALASRLSNESESFMVVTSKSEPLVDPTGRYIRIFLIGRHELGAVESKTLVTKIRAEYLNQSSFPQSAKIYLAGAPAQGVDYIHLAYSSFRWVALLALGISFALLLFYFRRWQIPAITVVLNLLSVAISYAVLVVLFIWGLGAHLLGTYRVNQIEAWVPIFIFAMLFGLSMDYQLFILMRVKEGADAGLSTAAAIRHGLVKTGAVVTSAAVILIGALSGLIFGRIASLQELGVGLAVALLIDATVIRGLILPAALMLFDSKKPRR